MEKNDSVEFVEGYEVDCNTTLHTLDRRQDPQSWSLEIYQLLWATHDYSVSPLGCLQ